MEELKDEAYILVAASADTTGNALTIAAYNVATNPEIYGRLTTELKEAFPDPEANVDFLTLEKLPYLVSILHSGSLHPNTNIVIDWSHQGSSSVSSV